MFRKKWKSFCIIGIFVCVFPAFITAVVNTVNKSYMVYEAKSGRTVEVGMGSYTIYMDVEDFIPCVLMSEIPITAPREALKAQAVVLRTYILREMKDNNSIKSEELNLPFTSYTKLKEMWFEDYRKNNSGEILAMLGNLCGIGKSEIFKQNYEYLQNIMSKTDMKVMKTNGELILPLFHETSNGKTRDGLKILGEKYKYLKSVNCPSDAKEKNYLGVKYMSIKDIENKLKSSKIIIYKDQKELFAQQDLDSRTLISLINCDNNDSSGYLLNMKIGDTVVSADIFAKALGLDSTTFEISEYEKGIRITTKGCGHGFGMSLNYAIELADRGKGWQDILKTFFDASICN